MFKVLLPVGLVVAVAAIIALIYSAVSARSLATATGVAPDPSCFSGSPCITYQNTDSGAGLQGISFAGPGLRGDSTNSDAVRGFSKNGNGVLGTTTFAAGATANRAGVLGMDKSTAGTGEFGVEGFSPGGVGAAGFTTGGPFGALQGVAASTTANGAGLVAISLNVTGPNTTTGTGVFADGGVGMIAIGESSLAHALELDVRNGASLLRGFNINGTTTTEEIQIDSSGNEILKGTLTQNGTPHFVSRTWAGAEVVAYGPRQTQPTMEDVGQARLINGQALVRMDSTFASAIDRSGNYLVFLTPEGDCNGLFIAGKFPSAFTVRELRGGHSSLTFDYRIVGKPYGSEEARLPLVTQRESLNAIGHSPLRVPITFKQ